MPERTRRTLTVSRTARICCLGNPDAPEHVFVLHGYGQKADDFIRPFERIATDGRYIVAPEALSRFYTDEMGEHKTVGASWMTRRDREQEIDDYVGYLDDVATSVSAEETPNTRTVVGFSQGAATASRWALLGSTSVDRLILWAGAPAQDLDLDEHAPRLRDMSLTIVVGSNDSWITPNRLERMTRVLEAYDIPTDIHRFDGGHRLHGDTLRSLFSSV
ncbi:esterase [Longibacter salinarum]|uniref:Esterase n=1 Tax=Longibacter salinarum TaxID=1850348 RepID=A0A2A8D064_9BACT|nr:dienelactone hydrolase family protein [Longibacter salinarum]PEN14306.1 esterase [Longibacter salinarum]